MHFKLPEDSFFSSFCCSVNQSCDPMDFSIPGFPVLHHLPVCSHSCPLTRWCHPNISSSVVPFSPRLQSFPATRSFPRSQFFASGGQSIGASASVSFLPVSTQDWFPLGLGGLISLQSKGLSRVLFSNTFSNFSPTPQFKSINSLVLSCSAFSYMTTGKTIALTRQSFVGKVMSLLFKMLSWLVITFLPRSKRLLISWLQSPSAVILELKKIACHCFHCFPIYLPWSDGTRCHDLCFLNVKF